MKIQKFFAFLMLAALPLTGCTEKEENPDASAGSSLSLSVSKVSITSATASVTCPGEYWYINCIEKSEIESYGVSTVDDYAKLALLEFKQAVIDIGAQEWLDVCRFGNDDVNFTGLLPNTDYVVYAGVIDMTKGVFTNGVQSASFKTQPKEHMENMFEIEAEPLSAVTLKLTIKRTDKNNYWYAWWPLYPKSEVDLVSDPEELIRDWYTTQSDFVAADLISWRTLIDDGQMMDGDLIDEIYYGYHKPDTEYTMILMILNTDGEWLDTDTFSFKMPAAEKSDNTFTFEEQDGEVTVTASKADDIYKDRFFWDIVPTAEYSAESFVNRVCSEFSASRTKLGSDTKDYSGMLTAGTMYTVAAFGWDGEPTTEVFSYEFEFGGDDDGKLTTLTGDKKVEFSSNLLVKYGSGSGTLEMLDEDKGEFISICLNTNKTNPAGSYEFGVSAVAGNRTFNEQIGDIISYSYNGSWWGRMGEKVQDLNYGFWSFFPKEYAGMAPMSCNPVEHAPLVSGTVTITRTSSTTYKVELNAKDTKEHTITASYEGVFSSFLYTPSYSPGYGE